MNKLLITSEQALRLVIYTGPETRSVMNNSTPRSKVGLLDMKVNKITKVLFVALIGLVLIMIALKGFGGPWYRYMFLNSFCYFLTSYPSVYELIWTWEKLITRGQSVKCIQM